MRLTLRRALVVSIVLAVALVTLASMSSSALAASWTNCNVNASGGYANCLSYVSPGGEAVQAYHAAGTPYRAQQWRPSDGAIWGWWQYNDLAYHIIGLQVTGTIYFQVDNLGSGNPNTYYVLMG